MQKTGGKIKVLFLCTGNSCRSQMAEGWTKHLLSDTCDGFSAGIKAHGLDARAVAVMKEAGVDISTQRSKLVDEFKDFNFDLVVTVCGHANEQCPVFLGAGRLIHAGFEDPPKLAQRPHGENEALIHYRRVRDEIKEFILRLPDFLIKDNQGDE